MAYDDNYVWVGTAPDTTLASDITSGSTTITLTSGSGWPSPTGGQKAIGVIAEGTSSEVKFTYTGRSGNDLTGVTLNFDGTTSASTYSAGTSVRHSIAAVSMNEFDYTKRETVGTVTAAADLLVADGANSFKRLGKGSAHQVLGVNSGATDLEYKASMQSLLTATGDIVYASAANTPARLAAGTNGHVLTLAAGVPTWAAASAGTSHVLVRKSADETVTSSTTLQNDDALLFAIGASETWIAEFVLFVACTSDTPDITLDFTVPAGASGMFGGFGLAGTATTTISDLRSAALAIGGGDLGFGAINGTVAVNVWVSVANSTNAGNVQLRWAQSSSNTAGVTVKAGSFLTAHKVS